MGTTLNDKLDWAENSATLLKKANQRLFFLKILKSSKVNAELLELFYYTATEFIVTYNSLCFYSCLKRTDTAKLSKVKRTVSMLIGSVVVDLQAHIERKALQRLRAILADPIHPLNEELTVQMSARITSGRHRQSKDEDETFLPVISSQCNTTLQRHSTWCPQPLK